MLPASAQERAEDAAGGVVIELLLAQPARASAQTSRTGVDKLRGSFISVPPLFG
jgi:hypothetical protein